MDKSRTLAQKQAEEICGSCHGAKLQINKIGEGQRESFRCCYWQKTLSFTAESPNAAVFGLAQLKLALRAGYTAAYLGEKQARCSQRWLWLVGSQNIPLDIDVGVGSPWQVTIAPFAREMELLEQQVEVLAQRLLLWGYSGLILGGMPQLLSEEPSSNDGDAVDGKATVKALVAGLHAYGLKVAIKPQGAFSPSAICKLIETYACDALLWESALPTPPCSKGLPPLLELYRQELHSLEQLLAPFYCQLLYYIPASTTSEALTQVNWLLELMEEQAESTQLLFAAQGGNGVEMTMANPLGIGMPAHPLWEELPKRLCPSNIPCLLPLLNIGSIAAGEGLWPAPASDLIATYLAPLPYYPAMAGAVVLTRRIPHMHTPLAAALWVAAQHLWGQQHLPQDLLWQLWLKAYYPHISNTKQWLSGWENARKAAGEVLGLLSVCRAGQVPRQESVGIGVGVSSSYEAALVYLERAQQQLKAPMPKAPAGQNENYMEDYLSCFVSDMRGLLAYAMQGKKGGGAAVSSPSGGFWSQPNSTISSYPNWTAPYQGCEEKGAQRRLLAENSL